MQNHAYTILHVRFLQCIRIYIGIYWNICLVATVSNWLTFRLWNNGLTFASIIKNHDL